MAKKNDKSFRVVIDKRIVRVYDSLDDTFSFKHIMEKANIPKEEQKSMYDHLERVVSYGLLHKTSESNWYKEYRGVNAFEKWLREYCRQVKETNVS
ncbi:MAG: hypothetical protein ABSF44_08645 [Candidatus Bathyarchaeia archaeon]|jgi:hypothetical protein